MAADLREMQENQWVSKIRTDKSEIVTGAFPVFLRPRPPVMLPTEILNKSALFLSADPLVQVFHKVFLVEPIPLAHLQLRPIPAEIRAEAFKGCRHGIGNEVYLPFAVRT